MVSESIKTTTIYINKIKAIQIVEAEKKSWVFLYREKTWTI